MAAASRPGAINLSEDALVATDIIDIVTGGPESAQTTLGNLREFILTPVDLNFLSTPVSAASLGNNTIIAAVPGKRICVQSAVLALQSPTTVTFKSGTGTSITGPMYITSLLLDASATPYFKTDVGEALVVALGDAVLLGGVIGYLLQDP